jgi:hypothetical protein
MEPTKVCVMCGKSFTKPKTISKAQWADRTCCTRKCGNESAAEKKRGRTNPNLAYWTGKKQSPESVAKRSATLRRLYAEGRIEPARANLGLRREQTSQWKGDDISYRGAHGRLKAERGRPTECSLCGQTDGWLEWALVHEPEVVKVQVGGVGNGMRYSPRPSDYIAVCRPCHRRYDERKRDARTGQYI